MSAKRILAFGDVHFPEENPEALAVLRKVAAVFKPDVAVSLGDLLDANGFSTHAPDPARKDTPYEHEVNKARALLDHLQKHSRRLVLIEGNHEHRIARHAARDRAGAASLSLLSPRKLLTAGRRNCTYIPYGAGGAGYPHHRLSPRLVAVHGWSYAANAAQEHLRLAQGTSVIHGHTHRAEQLLTQDVFDQSPIQVVGAGCLCKPVPVYGTGTPMRWVNGFVVGYLGRGGHTVYFVPITHGSCVLPDGKEIKA